MRKRKKATPLLVLLFILLIGAAGYEFYMLRNLKENNASLSATLENQTKIVYVATRDIGKGETLTDEGIDTNVETQAIASGLEEYNYITEADLGKKTIVPIATGLPIMPNMVTDKVIQKDTREYESYAVNLMTDQMESDFVDVRISFPSGEDYIVLAKKEITKLDLGNCIFTAYLNEEEIVRMTSAIVDAYVTKGAKIYTTRYVESNLQEDAIPNYPVKAATRDLINEDPNIITLAEMTLNQKAREQLEEHLGDVTETESSAIEGYQTEENTRKNTHLTGVAEEEVLEEEVIE